MKLRTILAAFAVMASGSLYAQNATKADLDKLTNQVNELSQRMTELESKATQFETKVAQLEADVERIVTENVNLVEQLNIKTVTSMIDNNGFQWDIVKVEPDEGNNNVVLTLRLTNKSGVMQSIGTGFNMGNAIDTNSNLANNSYNIERNNFDLDLNKIQANVPLNFTVTIHNVPTTCTYLATINIEYTGYKNTKDAEFKFTGVHIPW